MDSPAVFARSVSLLTEYQRNVRTNNFAVAVAVLLHRSTSGERRYGPSALIEPPNQGPVIETTPLQTEIVDPVYRKNNRFLPGDAEGPIYKPFRNSFKPESPATNNWRNSFDLQAGLGCDAPDTEEFLQSDQYLAEPRFDCRFRDPRTGECTSPTEFTAQERTCFNPNKRGIPPGPETNAKLTPKLLARGRDRRGTEGYWYIPPTDDVLSGLLDEPRRRIPIYAFAGALYGGSPYFEQWGDEVNPARFRHDLMLTKEQMNILFDPRPRLAANRAVLQEAGMAVPGPIAPPSSREGTPEQPSEPQEFDEDRNLDEFQRQSGEEPDPDARLRLQERATHGHERALRVLGRRLSQVGPAPLEQPDGYDLYTEVDGRGHLFEVKTWHSSNLLQQTRSGVAQLYEYRWRNRQRLTDTVLLYLVYDREPPIHSYAWLWRYLHEDRGILPTWISGDQVSTLNDYSQFLDWLR